MKQTVYSDHDDTLPLTSICGNKYIILLYNYEINAILSDPINNIQAATIKDGFVKLHTTFKNQGNQQMCT